ncbi:Os02g0297066, partial [Oryza sativa Japonica Group]
EVLRAEVGGHDDDGVGEVDGAALPVGEPPIVEDLEEDVEHGGVRLLHLVEQHHAVWPTPHQLGQLPALVVPVHIPWSGADEASDGAGVDVLGHVDADEQLGVAEQLLGEGLGELRLADAGRAEEEEGARRLVRVAESRPRPHHRLGDGANRLVLPDHATVQQLRQLEQLLPLVLPQARHRDARP